MEQIMASVNQSSGLSSQGTSPRLAVEASAFTFAYPEKHAIVGPLDWRVEQGAFQLLVGATGSGKTTLMRCLKPAIAPAGKRDGALAVFGTPVETLSDYEAAASIGYVSQSPENQIVCDTVWHEIAFGLENLGVPQATMRRRVAEVAHFFGIEPWFRRAVTELSGGQKQMVTLASALALQPRLLLLDEPTAQLDPVAEKNFLHALFRVNRELGITVVVATHTPEAMTSYATEVVELARGQVLPAPLAQFSAQPLRLEASHQPDASLDEERTLLREEVISLSDTYARYSRGGDWILRGCDLAVSRGQIHALVGGNGSGKSTLLRLVAGVLKAERGRSINKLAHHQALLPQDPKALFVCDTVLEELQEWQKSSGYSAQAVQEILQRFNLDDQAQQHPYDLSGGQQQKLALAKLLLTSPDLLLLDEPTKGLDASSKMVVAKQLIALTEAGATILLATHDLTFSALLAHRVTMLFDGEAACTERAHDFFASNLFYRPAEDAFARVWLARAQGSNRSEGDSLSKSAEPIGADNESDTL